MINSTQVDKIITGELKIKNSHSYNDFSPRDRSRLQEEFDNWRYLSVAEAAVWLGVSIHTIYKLIRERKIYATKLSGENGAFKIDVKKSKQYLYHL